MFAGDFVKARPGKKVKAYTRKHLHRAHLRRLAEAKAEREHQRRFERRDRRSVRRVEGALRGCLDA